MFDRMKGAYEKAATPDRIDNCRSWLKSAGSDLDPRLFMAMHTFHTVLEKEQPDLTARSDVRRDFYRAGKPAPALSGIVAGKAAECAEISLLAHAALRHMGFPNKVVCGGVAWTRDSEFSEKHTFIMLEESKDRTAIFDPANPVRSRQEALPAVYLADSRQIEVFEARAAKGDSLMAVKNALTGQESFFGAADGASVYLDRCAVYPEGHGSPPVQPVHRPK
jgi:hypothetical protein